LYPSAEPRSADSRIPGVRRGVALVVFGRASALLAGSVCVFIAGFLVLRAAPGLVDVGATRFISDGTWHPTPDASGTFSLLPAVVGSVLVTVLAALVALPLGVFAAVGSVFITPRGFARAMDMGMGVLAGIPSVVLGLWGLTALVPLVARLRPPGTSVLAASLTLSVMLVPTVYVTAASAFAAVPRGMLDAAAATGLSRWATLRSVALPVARSGLVVGAVLALTRAMGETMAVVMVAGNIAEVPRSILDPFRTLTANIALEMAYAEGNHRSILFASGALLMAVVTGLVLASRRLMPEVASD